MKNLKFIKESFYREFELISQGQVMTQPFSLPFDDFLIAKWQSEPLKRIFRLQETEDDDFLKFGFALCKAGLSWDYDDLLVMTDAANKQVPLIFQLYRLWFEEQKSPLEMEELLTKYYDIGNKMTDYHTDAIDLLTNLVSIPSPSEQEEAASRYLVKWLNEHGLTAQVDKAGNAVGVKGHGAKEILLLGHIDTFPGDVPVRREGDLLYGRGSVDAKGPLCTFAAAASLVDVPADWRITVVGAVEEECATSKGARYILQQRLSAEARAEMKFPYFSVIDEPCLPAPSFCVIGEPSHWDRVTLGYKGRLLMDVTLHVPFSHSAGEGRLPAEQGVDFWQAVERVCYDFNQSHEATSPFNRLDPSLRHIASHDEGAYGRVELSIGFRLPETVTPNELVEQLAALSTTLPTGTTAEIYFSGAEMAYKGDKSNPLVRAFLGAIRQANGQPRFVVKTGTADMNVVGPHWSQTPMVAYGPGDSSLDHTPDEHTSVTEYLQAIEVLRGALTKLMTG